MAGVHAAGGDAAIAHLWDGPAALPTEAEMDDPAAWVRRVVPDALRIEGGTADTGDAPGPDSVSTDASAPAGA